MRQAWRSAIASGRWKLAAALLIAAGLPVTLLAQVAAATVPAVQQATQSAAVGTDLFSSLPANGLLAMILVPVLQWLRTNKKIGWVNDRSIFWIAGAASALTALGIHGAISPTGFEAHGSWKDIGDGAFDIVKQWSSLHWGHKGLQVAEMLPKVMKAIVEANKTAGGPGTGGGT